MDLAARWRFATWRGHEQGARANPQRGLDMVRLIIVEGTGMMANYEAATSVTQFGKAAGRRDDLWARADALP